MKKHLIFPVILFQFFFYNLIAQGSLDFTDSQDIPENISLLTTSKYGNKIIINCGDIYPSVYDFLYIYDSLSDQWETFQPNVSLIDKRYGNGEIIGDYLYLFNGELNSNLNNYNQELEIINLTSGEVSYGTNNPIPREQAGSAQLNNNIYVFGGSNESNYYSSFYYYNTSFDSWTELPNMPEAKNTRGEILNNKLYTIGGYNGSVSNKIDVFDLTTNQWESQFVMPFSVSANSLSAIDDLIFILGDYTELNRIALFDTSNQTFINIENNMIGRRHFDSEIINSEIYIVGGNYTPSSESWLNSVQNASIEQILGDASYESINKIIIYPNPSTNFINIKSDYDSLQYEIYDTSSKIVQTGQVLKNNNIRINNLSQNTYFLKLFRQGFSKTFKFVKQN